MGAERLELGIADIAPLDCAAGVQSSPSVAGVMTDPLSAQELSRRSLVLAALQGATPIAGQRFGPGATVFVGSNSGNELVIPAKFELTAFKLISNGSVLHVAPPLHVQATVWIDGAAVELTGYIRDVKRARPELPEALPLASERFIIRYASGITFIGRFAEPGSGEDETG